MKLLVRFRSARLRDIAASAVAQKFAQEITGGKHYGLICPTCGWMVILSNTQPDSSGHRLENVIAELRRHGFSVQGKKTRPCVKQRGHSGTVAPPGESSHVSV